MPDRLKIVIDPGHGGTAAEGGSSPNNATGPAPDSLKEKDLTLWVSNLLRQRLQDAYDVILTRSGDTNLSLADRAAVARNNHADLFLSIHFNGYSDPSVDGTEVWVARQASRRSRDFAQAVLDRVTLATGVANRGVREGNLGVLLPARHDSGTAACLVEVAFLTNPHQASRLEGPAYLGQIADALAQAVCAQANVAVAHAVAAGAGSGSSYSSGATALWEPDPVDDERYADAISAQELDRLYAIPLGPTATTTPTLTIKIENVKIGSQQVALGRDGRGFKAFIRVPPLDPAYPGSSLDIVVSGRLMVEDPSGSLRSYDEGQDGKSIPLAGAKAWANVDISGGVQFAQISESKVARDGTFTTETHLGLDFVRSLTITAVVERKGAKRIGATGVVELIDLTGLLAIVDPLESARPKAQTHLEFLAALRKVYQGGPDDPLQGFFDKTLFRNRSVPPLASRGNVKFDNLRLYTVLYADGEYLDIGHVLTGIEGAPKQKPDYFYDNQRKSLQPQSLPKPSRPDLIVTWEGDLASALQKYILDFPAASNKGLTIDLNDYLRKRAGRADLIGDLDGINIGAAYDENQSIAGNLRAYYGKGSRRRFHQLIANSMGELPLEPGTKLPKLSKKARANIAAHVHEFLRAAYVVGVFDRVDKNLVQAMIQPGSPEMNLVVDYFVYFLENGLGLEARAAASGKTPSTAP